MKSKFYTLLVIFCAIAVVAGSCSKSEEVDLNAAYLGNYKIEYTYQEPYFNGFEWLYDTITTVDSTCELTEDENGDLLFINYAFFNDIPMHTYIEIDSICIPEFQSYTGMPYPNTYKAYGNVVDGEFILEINRSFYNWTFQTSIGQNGTAVATKID